MIFTIKNAEMRQSKVKASKHYIRFTLLDDYEHIHFANLFPSDYILDIFYKKNGIFWGDEEPTLDDCIGLIISAEIKRVDFHNKNIEIVELI